MSNPPLYLDKIIYHPTSHKVTLFFNWNGEKTILSAQIISSGTGNDLIRGIASEELSNFIMKFIHTEGFVSNLNKLFNIILNYADKNLFEDFPIQIM